MIGRLHNKGPEYTYTAAGRLLTRDWARTIPTTSTRVRTTYGYTHGRLTGVTYNDDTPDLVYTHDNFGRVKTVTRAGNAHAEYLYDSTHLRLITEELNIDIQERHLHRHYDTYGRPLSLNLATTAGTSQYTAGYGYDNAGRLDRVWHHPTLTSGAPQGSPTFTYGYTYTQASSGATRIGATTGSNLIQDFMPYTLTRNAVGADPALTATRSYQGTRDALHSIENKAGTTLVSGYTYGVNSLGQRDNVTTAGSAFSVSAPANWTWQYDSRGQLTVADSPTAARDRAYEFDPIGNRKKFAHATLTLPGSDNYTANALNQYSVVPDYTPQPVHDLDGNLTRGSVPGTAANTGGIQTPADATELTWDAENRLISCKIGTDTFYYAYDHLSRLMARGEATPLNRRFYYDGWNRIAEYSLSTVHNTFTWGLDLSGTMQGAGGVGGLLAHRWASDSGQPDYFPTYDGNGNVTEYLASAGAVEVHYEYDPFGGLTRRTGNSSTRFQYRFSTKPRDWNTGLYYYGYRWYNTYTGSWPSRDPIGERGGINLYGFVGNNGLNRWDLLGMQSADSIMSPEEFNRRQNAPNSFYPFGDPNIDESPHSNEPTIYDAFNPFGMYGDGTRDYKDFFSRRYPGSISAAIEAIKESVDRRVKELCHNQGDTIDTSGIAFGLDQLDSDFEKYGDDPQNIIEMALTIGRFSLYVENVEINWQTDYWENCSYKWNAVVYIEENTGASNPFNWNLSCYSPDALWFTGHFVERKLRMAELGFKTEVHC